MDQPTTTAPERIPMTTDEQFLADFHAVAEIGATPAMGVHREAATEDGIE